MKVFGKVEVILNEDLVILSSSEDLYPNDVVNVFSLIDDGKLKELGYAEPILYPKGMLKILCQQEDKRYLAESFREIIRKTKTITRPSPYASASTSLMALWMSGQSVKDEIEVEVPGERSAVLNKDESLKIPVAKVVSNGDLIGRV